ncbi:MAG TPA: glycoside hydrolase family 36 protein, partial [Cytophagaceae bacterium]
VDRWEANNYELIDVGFSTESIPTNNTNIILPALHFYGGRNAFNVFTKLASDMATVNKVNLKQAPAYHWCSWYETEKKFNEALLTEVLNGLSRIKPSVPVQTIQIDDGYFTHYGDWLHFDSTKFPSGFENNVKKIQKLGYRPGVWIGPFMVNERSELFKKHPDWILHNLDGSLVVEWENKEEGNTYILDTSNPEAFEYLKSVFRKLRSIGFTYYKTDFMDWGLRNSVKYKRYTPGKTSSQYFDDVLKMIRQEIGQESFWLGCIMPFAPAVGYVDAIRNSNDVGRKWASTSHGNMIEESMHSQYTNNVLWQTDPDVVYLNSFKTELTQTECTTLALFDGMLGGVINTSDRFHNLSAENLKMWRFIQPSINHTSAKIPLWDKVSNIKILVRNHDNASGGILFTNDKDTAVIESFPLKDLVNKEKKHLYRWEPGSSSYGGLLSDIKISLQPHESKLYYFSDVPKAPGKDLGLYGTKVKGL